MFGEIYHLSKYKVEITAIENGWLVSVNKPNDQEEMIGMVVDGIRSIKNEGENWNSENKTKESGKQKPDNGVHFFKKDEPELMMAFLSDLFIGKQK
jgi:hypothetical protein